VKDVSVDPLNPLDARRGLESVRLAAGTEIRRGDRVRLRPLPGADIMDLALAGRTATVVAIERDYENRVHVAVTVDDDPGRDLGEAGKIAHRFFFGIDEVEPITNENDPHARRRP
jgi:hypothetical protein